MQLRDYQQSALDSINDAYKKGINRQLIVLATGLGKTVIFSHLISQRIAQTKKKALIIAHREELLLQAKNKLEEVDSILKVGIEQAEKVADHTKDDVVIASVQTIGKIESQRLSKFNPNDFSVIIIDEAHHASATTYKNILRYFGVLKNENASNREILLLGVTATPKRNDNKGIDQIFDEVVYEYTLIDGVRKGWLSSIHALKVNTPTKIDDVHSSAGDFVLSELEEKVNSPERNALVVKTYKDIAHSGQALVFAVDVLHTETLAHEFQQAGIKSAYITGETKRDERKKLLESFEKKDIQVMVNALVLTEGYDNAGIEYIFMARPTQSGILYNQMIGRGTRKHEEKTHVTIVDFVDNTTKHILQTAATLLRLEGTIDFQGNDILSLYPSIEKLLEKRPYYNLNTLKVENIDYLLKEVALLEQQELERKEESFTWHRFGETMRLHHGKQKDYLIEQSLTGQFVLFEYLIIPNVKRKVSEFMSQGEAMKYVDTLVVQSYGGINNPTSYGTPWGNDIPTEAQINLLRQLGVNENKILFLTKAEASVLISQLKRRRE